MRGVAKRSGLTGATVGYEAWLWQVADAQRGSSNVAEHLARGLAFLRHVSHQFDCRAAYASERGL